VGDRDLGLDREDFDGVDVQIEQWFLHPNYDGSRAYFDIAVVRDQFYKA
jgi:hypothetical protein